jgi:hypothetical protein
VCGEIFLLGFCAKALFFFLIDGQQLIYNARVMIFRLVPKIKKYLSL